MAGLVSYQLQLSSIDYALKRYVKPNTYDGEELLLGDEVSDYLRDSVMVLMKQLRLLQTKHPTFGTFGAEITIYRLPHSLDTGRLLSNRGLLLEVLPILRLCLEMLAWSSVAFHMKDEARVVALKAQSCIAELKSLYPTAGRLYGYLSTFSHWGHVIHGHFLDVRPEQVSVLKASVRYRAMALALCLVILDVFVEVVRMLYPTRSDALISEIQGVIDRTNDRKTHRTLARIVDLTKLDDLQEIQALLE